MGDYKTYGYEIRKPGVSERLWFSKHRDTAGMATEDGKIILNPYSNLDKPQRQLVIKNEASRLWLRENNIVPDFELTPEQKQSFTNTPYANDEGALKQSVLGRIISGDPSALNVTPRQAEWADWLDNRMKQAGGDLGGFDPEGSGYDEKTAEHYIKNYPLNIPKPKKYQGDYVSQPDDESYQSWVWHPELDDYVKHSGSLDPRTGMVLKGKQHKTWGLMEEAEKRRGSQIIKKGNRYYSVPLNNNPEQR